MDGAGHPAPPGEAIYSIELEPNSFDDLALGGEWTTRRRTISESEIALFAAVAGDFSPLSVDTSGGTTRHAQPALLVAMALGLGSMDMPVPQIASWEWVNWTFPKAVRAGETIYATWTLTQKRPPLHGSPTAIAVWRVDVHTSDGAVVAEGEVGASVFRRSAATVERASEPVTAQGGPAPRRRSRRRRATSTNEPTGGNGLTVAAPAAPASPSAGAPASSSERASGSRRRRRRRSPGSAGSPSSSGGDAAPASAAEPAAAASPTPPASQASRATPTAANPLSRVMRRIRGT